MVDDPWMPYLSQRHITLPHRTSLTHNALTGLVICKARDPEEGIPRKKHVTAPRCAKMHLCCGTVELMFPAGVCVSWVLLF